MEQEDGEAIIHEYYDVAPTIENILIILIEKRKFTGISGRHI
ncbi:MAG: hypothetical protein V8T31_05140 [Lachnospiraceae bacterium]